MRLSERISSCRHLAMTLLVIAASLEYSLAHTSWHGALKAVKIAAALVLAWGFYRDQRLVFANWQMKLSRRMLLQVALLVLALLGFQAAASGIQILVKETNAYGAERTEQLEIGLQMAAYPLLILLLSLLTDGYAAWLRRHSKHLTLLLYLFLWVWCGAYYFYMAERTRGGDFVFSEQAKIETTMNGLSADDRYDDYDAYRVKEILEKSQYKKDYLKLPSNEFLTVDETGADWGDIYENGFIREGYAYYSFQAAAAPLTIATNMLDYDSLAAWKPLLGTSYKEVDVRLYKPAGGTVAADELTYVASGEGTGGDRPDEAELGKPAKTVKLYFAGRDYERFMQVFGQSRQDRHLSHLIAASHTLLDGKFLELYIGINGYTSYRFEDFLYFSAITITTLGFGDITPNSGPVKAVVMGETLLGVLLVGIYVSLVSHKKRER